ncbi:hypothetical protein Cgig2_017978 [Carnegiea gigantea]|uniref:Uncharacterized protein n=1 Tax=Carnegiea gigantea TaxID=171969 RepID=A0A9Q1Q5N8_9CARY|nr:hypothetical protein Cgig2_017978 [Carnegiea gigantea]
MAFSSINILKHTLSVYMIEAFLMFEKEFIDEAIHNYKAIETSDQYITRRWCKGIKDGQNLDLGKSTGKEHMGCPSACKMQMMRKMNSIITASQMNKNARAPCEKYLMEFKELIKFDVGSIHCDEDGHGKYLNSLLNLKKKCDQVKQRKTKKLSKTNVGSSTAPPQLSWIAHQILPVGYNKEDHTILTTDKKSKPQPKSSNQTSKRTKGMKFDEFTTD